MLYLKLGFKEVDLSSDYFPRYVLRYVSPGGNSSLECEVTFDIDNLNDFIEFIDTNIKWKKSVKAQRALMTSKLRKYILDRDGHICKYCGANVCDEPNLLLEIDHIVPISKGGMTKEDNLQTLCWRYNRKKGANLYIDSSIQS